MPLLKTKLSNQLKKLIPENEIKISLKNIIINGSKRGCSGHITYLKTGKCVYVTTEPLITDPRKLMWRYAENEKDFTSNRIGIKGKNHFITEPELATTIIKALTADKLIL